MEGRAYTIWTNFLEENKLPYCFMAYPAMDQKNELQFEDIEEEDGTQRRKVKMEFRHTRKRMWLLRAGDKIMWASTLPPLLIIEQIENKS